MDRSQGKFFRTFTRYTLVWLVITVSCYWSAIAEELFVTLGDPNTLAMSLSSQTVLNPSASYADSLSENHSTYREPPREFATATPIPPVPPQIVINEVYYNDPGTDDCCFVELYGLPGQSLDGVILQPINSSCIANYSLDLSGYSIPQDGYLVIAQDSLVPNYDIISGQCMLSLQNGPCDGVVLLYNGAIIDAVMYAALTYCPAACGEGTPVPELLSDEYTISRYPDGEDTDDNAADFGESYQTAGEPNLRLGIPTPTIIPVPTELAQPILVPTTSIAGLSLILLSFTLLMALKSLKSL